MAKTKRQVLDILEAWQLLDLLEQGSLNKPHGKKDEPSSGSHYLFEPDLEGQDELPVARTCVMHIGECKKGNPRLAKLSDTAIYLGKIARRDVVNKLAALMPELEGEGPVEDEMGSISPLLVKVSAEGQPVDVELSPLMWALRQAVTHGGLASEHFPVKDYEARADAIKKEFCESEGPLTWRDIDVFAKRHALPYVSALYGDVKPSDECLAYRLVDFSLVAPDADEENPATLSMTFFAKDIEAVRDEVDGGKSLAELRKSSLALALGYVAGKEEADTPPRLDMRHGEGGDRLLRFYTELLDPANLPLGKWPSRHPLALMQQAAVNMAAGRRWGWGEFPANDIVSVNGPPGTGKTTLLKDIVAANIVRKARLLAEYDEPDKAFAAVKYRHEKSVLSDRTYYLDFAREVYRLKNDEINDYGIIVCSSNNAAVENISVELPKGSTFTHDIKPGGSDTPEDGMLDAVCRLFSGASPDTRRLLWGKKGESREQPDVYFSHAARMLYSADSDKKAPSSDGEAAPDEDLWVLVSARLGRKGNINRFIDDVLDPIYWLIPRRDGIGGNVERYRKTRERFLGLYDEVEAALRGRSREFNSYGSRLREREEVARELDDASRRLEDAKAEAGELEAKLEESVGEALAVAERICFEEGDPVVPADWMGLETFWQARASRLAELQAELGECDEELEAARRKVESVGSRLLPFGRKKSERDFKDAKRRHAALQPKRDRASAMREQLDSWLERRAERSSSYGTLRELRGQIPVVESRVCDLAARRDTLSEELAGLGTTAGKGSGKRYLCPTGEFIASLGSADEEMRRCAQLSNPTSTFELDRKREELFYWALQLTRDFILASSCMKKNILSLEAMWGKEVRPQKNAKAERIVFDERDRRMAMPILMQSLLVLTPVVSSTFASIGRMLADVPMDAGNASAPFGLLVIDEAGQALPMAALGALARSRRAVIVGDPLQVEPVVSDDLSMLRQIWNDRLGREYVGKEASVQCIADARNPYGGYISSGDEAEPTWLGCPLVVHRRCLSPMFDISNAVSYSGTMLNETREPSGDKRFCLPSSVWIDVTGTEVGNKNHHVQEQAEQALAIISRAFGLRENSEQPPSLYVVSPFTSVVNGLKRHLKRYVEEHIPVDNAAREIWDTFVENHVGTVHTFQGKEADEVIFLLGCDERARGAIRWVSPNIVNVAASRAKYRLYVVGNADAWSKNASVSKMKGLLEVCATTDSVPVPCAAYARGAAWR